MGLHHWHSPLSEEPQIGPQIGRNQCWGPWVSRISHWFWHMAQAHSLVAAMIQQSALCAFFLVVEPEFLLGSPEMDDLGVPLFQEPPLLVRATIAFAIEFFFRCFNFTLFSMCVHQIPISVCPQFFFFDQNTFNAHFNGLVKSSILLKSPYVCHHFMVKSVKSSSFCFSQITSECCLQGPAVGPNERRPGDARRVAERWNMLVSPWNMEVSYGWNSGSCVIVPLFSILWKKKHHPN